MNASLHTAAALLLSLTAVAATGCIDQDADLSGGEELDVGQTDQAVTSCAPTISAAAITRQISSLTDPVIDMTIVTLSPQPNQWQIQNVTGGPTGALLSNFSSSCTLRSDGLYRCAHNFRVSPGRACFASGNYALTVRSVGDAGTCGTSYTGTLHSIPFSITTENMCSYDLDGVVDGY